ncbi:hypothetical protein CMALT394_650010 [Carnobacterium maltaromaticum]|nr:hypothetical protein CMALT394_650010 [Carnobacterium maltaromaticum]
MTIINIKIMRIGYTIILVTYYLIFSLIHDQILIKILRVSFAFKLV